MCGQGGRIGDRFLIRYAYKDLLPGLAAPLCIKLSTTGTRGSVFRFSLTRYQNIVAQCIRIALVIFGAARENRTPD